MSMLKEAQSIGIYTAPIQSSSQWLFLFFYAIRDKQLTQLLFAARKHNMHTCTS